MVDYPSGEQRLEAMGRGAIYPPGQYADILQARLEPPEPPELAEEFGLPVGRDLLVRTRLTYQNGKPVALSRSYFHPECARLAPDLLKRERIIRGTVAYLAEMLETRVGRSREQVWADVVELDCLPAQMLGVCPGTRLLWAQNWWSTPNGTLLELGLSVTVPRLRKTYERVIA